MTNHPNLEFPIGDCAFVTRCLDDLYDHETDTHPGEELRVSRFRNLDLAAYKEQAALRNAKTMDQINKIFSGQEGPEPVEGAPGPSGFVAAGGDGEDDGEDDGGDPGEWYGGDNQEGEEEGEEEGKEEGEEEGEEEGAGEGDGGDQVGWEAAEGFIELNFANFAQACTEDIRREYGTAPRSRAEMEDVIHNLRSFFAAIALAARDNL